MARIERNPFQTLGIKMRAAEGLNKIEVFGVAFFSALAAVITAPAALFGKNIFQLLVFSAYPSSNTEFRTLKLANDSVLKEFDQNLLEAHKVEVCRGDIFESGASVIVNPANPHLGTSGNRGLNAAIIQRGGDLYRSNHDRLREQEDGHFQPGDAAIIPAGKLVVEKGIENVIVVSPPDRRGKSGPVTETEMQQLFSSYYNALELADQAGHETIAIPSLGTGINRFPPDVGAWVCKQAIAAFYTNHPESNLHITVYAQGDDEYNSLTMSGRLLPYEPASRARTVSDLVFGLPKKVLQAVQSLRAEVPVDQQKLEEFEDCRKKAGQIGHRIAHDLENAAANIYQLRNNLQLGVSAITQVANYIEQTDEGSTINYHSNFGNLPNREAWELPGWEDKHKDGLSFFPIGLDTKGRKHWVIAVVDPKAHTIEFYDPKGLTIEDYASAPLDSFPNHTLKSLMNKIALHYTGQDPSNEWKVLENTERHQTDAYNCGVYIADYMYRRAAGESFNQIRNDGMTFEEASTTGRGFLVDRILDSCEVKYQEYDDTLVQHLRDNKDREQRRIKDQEIQNEAGDMDDLVIM